jgi:RimJ/RimL family protein N-acetyltransferase
MQTPELHTERLRLDALTLGDAELVAEYCLDPVLQGFVPVPVPYTRSEADGYTGDYARSVAKSPRGVLFAIRRSNAPGLLGVIELMPRDDEVVEVGFWMGAPHRGSGYMTEALRRVVAYAFDECDPAVHRILWRGYVGNEASAAAARGAGFQYEGVERSATQHRGVRVDMVRAALLPGDPREATSWP